MSRYIQRSIEPVLKEAASQFPAVSLTGPRQSGKTTLLQHVFGENFRYVTLEDLDTRMIALNDPRNFLDIHPPPVIFDEIQHAPHLLSYIKGRIDANRDLKGQYIFTGSQNLLLSENVTESLAGRVAVLRLLPIARREEMEVALKPLPWERNDDSSSEDSSSFNELWKSFVRGSYPELVKDPKLNAYLWHASYIETYLERDVRNIRQIGDLMQFQNFLRILAARSGQLLNLTDIARTLGVAVNTIKAWVSVLEATYQIIVIRPYYENVGKRLVKTPKVYFTDVGTLCYLSGLKDPEHAAFGPMGGSIFETAVLSEIYKTLLHRGVLPRVFFWRTMSGIEVDFLVKIDNKVLPIEVKLTTTPNSSSASGIKSLQSVLKEKLMLGYVVHPGTNRVAIRPDVTLLPFSEL